MLTRRHAPKRLLCLLKSSKCQYSYAGGADEKLTVILTYRLVKVLVSQLILTNANMRCLLLFQFDYDSFSSHIQDIREFDWSRGGAKISEYFLSGRQTAGECRLVYNVAIQFYQLKKKLFLAIFFKSCFNFWCFVYTKSKNIATGPEPAK